MREYIEGMPVINKCIDTVTNRILDFIFIFNFVLPNGHVYDTSDPEDYFKFQARDGEISDGILALQKKILGNEVLVQKIKNKYKINK